MIGTFIISSSHRRHHFAVAHCRDHHPGGSRCGCHRWSELCQHSWALRRGDISRGWTLQSDRSVNRLECRCSHAQAESTKRAEVLLVDEQQVLSQASHGTGSGRPLYMSSDPMSPPFLPSTSPCRRLPVSHLRVLSLGFRRIVRESLLDVRIHLLRLMKPIPVEEGNRYNVPAHRR